MHGVVCPRRRPGRGVWLAVLLTLALAVPLVFQGTARAQPATIEVENLNDNGPGSLRKAIADVAAGGEITFAAGLSGTITLASPLDIVKDLTITGPGAEVLALSGGGTSRVMFINQDPEVAITGLTIRDGDATVNGIGGGIALNGRLALSHSVVTANSAVQTGGGIHVEDGELTLIASTISGNSAGSGGGIGTFLGTVTLVNSTVSGNTAQGDGGGLFFSGPPMTLIDSTVTGNTAGGNGGGIYNYSRLMLTGSTVAGNTAEDGGGIYNDRGHVGVVGGSVTGNTAGGDGGGIYSSNVSASRFMLTNSTVAGNKAGNNGGGFFAHLGEVRLDNSTVAHNSAGSAGGGIYAHNNFLGDSLALVNITVVGNTSPNPGSGIFWDVDGPLEVTGNIVASLHDTSPVCNTTIPGIYSLASDATCFADDGTNLPDTDPLLEPLAANGGPSETMLPGPGSPAVNAIPAEACALDEEEQPLPDQRGVLRPQGGACDIGAVELTFAEQWPRMQGAVQAGAIPAFLKPRLLVFLDTANLALERDLTSAACYTLQTFADQVALLSPTYIAADLASQWQAHVQTTRLLIGCS